MVERIPAPTDFPVGKVRTLRKLLPEELAELIERHQAFRRKHPVLANPMNPSQTINIGSDMFRAERFYQLNESLETFGAPSTAFITVDVAFMMGEISHAECLACMDIIDTATIPMFDVRRETLEGYR